MDRPVCQADPRSSREAPKPFVSSTLHTQGPRAPTMNEAFVKELRDAELELVVALMDRGASVLEIGAGAGWQAKLLEQRGYHVTAVDLASSEYRMARVFPVEDYDGRHLPWEAGRFDYVFSSNVLEHVAHIDLFQREIRRVLKPEGRAIHILPSATWRVWTLLSHYANLIRRTGGRSAMILRDAPGNPGALARLRRVFGDAAFTLVPERHGERGNALSETYYFSRFFWRRLFRRHGWRVVACCPNRLFYSGHQIAGERLSFPARKALSRILGSACLVYVLEAEDQ